MSGTTSNVIITHIPSSFFISWCPFTKNFFSQVFLRRSRRRSLFIVRGVENRGGERRAFDFLLAETSRCQDQLFRIKGSTEAPNFLSRYRFWIVLHNHLEILQCNYTITVERLRADYFQDFVLVRYFCSGSKFYLPAV